MLNENSPSDALLYKDMSAYNVFFEEKAKGFSKGQIVSDIGYNQEYINAYNTLLSNSADENVYNYFLVKDKVQEIISGKTTAEKAASDIVNEVRMKILE